ncbi:MAG: glycosyltransferase family 4 protein [Candidatus Eisenbacteria sp.]|nr:glycosyltransferase family 4 protein [Candidatus Eisenbacteria bacterium]
MPRPRLRPRAIVQIVRGLSRSGGISGVAFELAAEFRRRGHPVENVCLYPPEQAEGIDLGEVSRCPRLAALCRAIPWRHLRLMVEVPLFTLIATRSARQRHAALVIVHGDGCAGDLFVAHSCHRAAIAAKIAARRWAWALWPLHAYLLLRELLIVGRGFRFIVGVSREVARQFRHFHRIPPERIVSIVNGVDRDRFHPAASKPEARLTLGLPAEATILLFVGHQFATKGLGIILEGLARCGTAADPLLLVIGDDRPGPYRARAARLGIAGRVHFLGRQSEIERYYQAADLLVLLSEYEALGLVGLEALSCGVPVMATRTGGITEYLQDGVNGVFVERSAAAVGERLGRLLANEEERRRLAEAARPSTRPFAWSVIADEYLRLGERIAGADREARGER